MRTMALDLGGTMIKSALVSENGSISEYKETPSNGNQGGTALLSVAFGLADKYKNFDRIGISTAGQVNVADGSIRYANENIPGYTGARVKDLFGERYHCPVTVENDVNSAALGEAKFGAGKGIPNFICLTYGTGIGGGIILGGELYRGADGIAGELGHIITHPGGKLCGCGNCGCYEAYASTTALVAAASARDHSVTNGRKLFEHLDEMTDIIGSWVDEIALGLVTLTHIFNPGAIILGGGIMQEQYILEQLQQKFYPQLMESYRGVKLKCAELGNKAGLLGASVG